MDIEQNYCYWSGQREEGCLVGGRIEQKGKRTHIHGQHVVIAGGMGGIRVLNGNGKIK